MASSRQNSSQMLNSQSSSSNSTNSTSGKDKTVHSKADSKSKHDKSSSSSSSHVPMSSNTIINSMNNMSKRKGTSFQITSVSVSSGNNNNSTLQHLQQRTSADNNNGDDSADDLDESHTDDNISRITDYETPSFSEDTFSREDVFFAQPNAFGTAPVIPTSSQYGLAIVGPDMGGNGANMDDVHVSVSDAGINIMGQIPSKQDVDHKNERFKVVKIESTEPFKRGRWMCMDYLDHTTLQAQDDGIDGSSKEDGDENYVRTKDNDLESGDNIHDNGDMEQINDNDYDQEVMRAEMTNHHDMNHQASHEHHTMTSIPMHTDHSSMMSGQHQSQAQSMLQGKIQQTISSDNNYNLSTATIKDTTVESSSSITLPNQASHSGGNQQNPSADNSPVIQHHAQTMTPDMIHRSLENPNISSHQQNPQSQQQQQPYQGVTLPTNILMQNLGLDQRNQQSQTNASNASASPIPSNSSEYVGESESKQHKDSTTTSQFQQQQFGTGDTKQGSNDAGNQQQQQQHQLLTNDNIISSSVSENSNMNNNEGTQSNLLPSSSAGLGTATEGGAVSANEVSSNNASNAPTGDDGLSINEDSESIRIQKARIRRSMRSSHLPHQIVKDRIMLTSNIGRIFDGVEGMFTKLLKTNFLNNKSLTLDQSRLANTNTHTQNLNLSDHFSRTAPVAAKSRASDLTTVAALNINLSSLSPLYSSSGVHHNKDMNSSTRVSRAASPALGTSAENNSASGTSAVAIDNKIEQAMDLVKSHLMFAVREEVEVLKEKIAELMDRINQLEVENTILKANASPETLSQLTSAATIVVSPQVTPAQPQSSPALSKINIDATVLQVSNLTSNLQSQQQLQPPINPPAQNSATTS